jgi:predicted ABC-type ATPase
MTKLKVIIVSGVPGSGKSTWLAKQYAESVEDDGTILWPDNVVYISADRFFMRLNPANPSGPLMYEYNPAEVSEAHRQCFRTFAVTVSNPENVGPSPVEYILVDNTNIDAVEIAPYVMAAQAYGADIELITFFGDVSIFATRNVHAVPAERVQTMYRYLLGRKLPPWWSFKQRWLNQGEEVAQETLLSAGYIQSVQSDASMSRLNSEVLRGKKVVSLVHDEITIEPDEE